MSTASSSNYAAIPGGNPRYSSLIDESLDDSNNSNSNNNNGNNNNEFVGVGTSSTIPRHIPTSSPHSLHPEEQQHHHHYYRHYDDAHVDLDDREPSYRHSKPPPPPASSFRYNTFGTAGYSQPQQSSQSQSQQGLDFDPEYMNKSLPPTPAPVPETTRMAGTGPGPATTGALHKQDPSGLKHEDIDHPTASHALATSHLSSASTSDGGPGGSGSDSFPKGAVDQIDPAAPPMDRTKDVPGNRIATNAHGVSTVEGSLAGEAPVTDLGWHDPPEQIPKPLVGGISNDDLWTLLRRFDKQVQHVRALPPDPHSGSYPHSTATAISPDSTSKSRTTNRPPGDLDLQVSPNEQFSPDRMRGTIERLYMTVFIGVATFAKHLARLRSWEEYRRTLTFCITYFAAWSVDLLGPLLWGLLMVLILVPRARSTLFPAAAPLAAVDAKTGKVKGKVPAGQATVGMSEDSLTGAKESQKGEAVEQEAHNFVSAFGGLAISSAAGKQHPSSAATTKDTASKSTSETKAPDPTSAAISAIDAKDSAEGTSASGTKHATKQPIENALWEKSRPAMQGLGILADTWEQFSNMLSPTPPFPVSLRYRLALAVPGPMFLASLVVTPYMLVKSLTFALGFAFFGDPVIRRVLAFLDRKFPQWKEALDLRNTLLKRVPTNAQLTLTLLRIGEVHHAPLPPPPRGATTAAPPSTPPPEESKPPTEHHDEKKKSKFPQKALSTIKSTTKAAVNTALRTDHFKAKVIKNEAAVKRLGAVPEDPKSELLDKNNEGPKTFSARHMGVKGTAVILEPRNINVAVPEGGAIEKEVVKTVGPVLKWTRDTKKKSSAGSKVKSAIHGLGGHNDDDEREDANERAEELEEEEEGFAIPIEDIVEVEKLGGLGWKGKVVVGWSLDREVIDAVRVVYRRASPGGIGEAEKHGEVLEEKILTAVVGREEIVNRLLAMGGQRWVCC